MLMKLQCYIDKFPDIITPGETFSTSIIDLLKFGILNLSTRRINLTPNQIEAFSIVAPETIEDIDILTSLKCKICEGKYFLSFEDHYGFSPTFKCSEDSDTLYPLIRDIVSTNYFSEIDLRCLFADIIMEIMDEENLLNIRTGMESLSSITGVNEDIKVLYFVKFKNDKLNFIKYFKEYKDSLSFLESYIEHEF